MIWFWTFYIAVGTYILVPGIVTAWDIDPSPWAIKVLGSILAVLIWPLVFVFKDS